MNNQYQVAPDFRNSTAKVLYIIFFLTTSLFAIHANALPPNTTIISADSVFTNDFDCPFPLIEKVSGSYQNRRYFNENGILVREFFSPQFQGSLTVSWTNPATGATLTSHEASMLMIYYNEDGTFRKASNQGLTFMVSVPGEGPLLIDVGRIVIERGKGITFEVGPHQELNGETRAFCNYLAR